MTVVTDFMRNLNDPAALLRRFHITIAGGGATVQPNGSAPIVTCKVSDLHDTVQGFKLRTWFGATKARPVVSIATTARKAMLGADEFDAYYIPMAQIADIAANQSRYTLPNLPGSLRHMVTSQITGCVFSIGSDAHGNRLCSHIQPPALGPTLQNKRDGRQAAMAASAPGFHTLSRQTQKEVDFTESCTVLGYRSDAGWSIYLQDTKRATNTNGVVTLTKGLVSAAVIG